MRRAKIFFAAAALLFATPATLVAGDGDMAVVEQRMYSDLSKGSPASGEVESLIKSITSEGGFTGIDYQDEEFNSGDKKRIHLQKTSRLAKAYADPKNKYYKSEKLYNTIEGLLSFWIKSDLDDANWWHRSIGFPKDMLPAVVLIREPLSQKNPKLYSDIIDYLGESWEGTPPRFKTGANGTDICKITFTKAMLDDDKELMSDVMAFVGSLIFIAKGGVEEGVYPDFSFSQHSANGRQLYLGTYGREYLDGTLFFMEYTNGTEFALEAEKVAIIENLVLGGVAWMWYKNELDPNQCGRKIYDKENFAMSFLPITKRIIALNTPQNEALKGVLEMMEGKREIVGTKAYPYHDYLIHRGEGYMTTIRMTSTRTVGNEAGNGQGFENYHTGDGATYFKVFGDEYSPIFPKWNWRFIPGTTIVADDAPMPKPMWGKDGIGGNDYAGVAATESTGVAGFIFEKDQAIAHKAWFNFKDLTVALGAGITTARTDAPVITTVNQTTLRGGVDLSKGGIWHNSIGYKSLDKQNIEIEEDKKSSILMLSIDHGVAPSEASYAYAVYPNIECRDFKSVVPSVEILSNSSAVQAVREMTSGEVMAVFYSAGVVKIDKKRSLEVSMPAVVICTPNGKDGYDIIVGNPFCENAPSDEIKVTID